MCPMRMTKAMAWALPLVVSSWAAAAESALSVDNIVARTRAVMEKLPEHTVCSLRIESALVDKSGKVELDDKRDTRATLRRREQEIVTERAWRNGKELTPAELADERKQAEKRGKDGH